MKIKKGDKVLVIKGKDKGKIGKITSANHRELTVKVSGVNIVKKHIKARGSGKSGGIVEMAAPLNVSKVAYLCTHCGDKPTKLGYKMTEAGKKERICKKCKSTV